MHRFLKAVVSLGSVFLLTIGFTLAASAHEHRAVADGKYAITTGSHDEPAPVNQKNGLDLRVCTVEGEEPVEGLAETLTAEVIYGDQSMELELEPVFNQPGPYRAIFFPT